MIFQETKLEGVYLLSIEPYEDHRGVFARTVCSEEFSKYGLSADFVQQSISYNPFVGTLRGMHWQDRPYPEEKLVRVTSGSIFDVVVDVRPESNTYKSWLSVELSSSNHNSIYIPKGFAHGFQTLKPDTEVLYEMTAQYNLESSRGFIWNDPSVGIDWPEVESRIIGVRDSEYKVLG